MPRNNGIYSPPSGTTAVSQTPISSAAYNNFVTDITADQNNPRPIIAGGTGAATAGGARTALGLGDAATRNVGTTAGTVAAGDDSRITGALPTTGGTMTGPLTLPASTTAATSLHIEPGVDPTAPANGDVWVDSANDGVLRLRRNGVTTDLWDTASLALVSKADAEAGTSTVERIWSAERVAQAIAALTPPGLGIGQTWQDVKASRVKGTSYQNTTGRPIEVNVAVTASSGVHPKLQVSTDNSTWLEIGYGANGLSILHGIAVIPNGYYYRVNVGNVIELWAELR